MTRSQFDRARAHYKRHAKALETTPKSDWAIDAYAWQWEAGLVLTPIERAFWSDIRGAGAVLYPQFPVGRFFVDFANPRARIAIECDGAAWHTDKEADAARQREIEQSGWTVYRLTGRACLQNDDEVYDEEAGRFRYVESEPTLFLREICRRHGIRLGSERNRERLHGTR